jgi:hypothetical protein
MPPRKRVRGGKPNGILKAAWSAPRTWHKPATRIPKSRINNKPKEAGRGAERLTTPNSQGICHQSPLGPSLEQGWAVEAPDGQLIWVEGSVEEMAHPTDSAVQQQQEEVQQECFEIPKDFKTGYQALLVATQANWACGAVREIKCRLCPDTKFKKWVNSSGTATAWRRTRSRSTSVSIAGITSRAVTRANGTAKIGPPNASK